MSGVLAAFLEKDPERNIGRSTEQGRCEALGGLPADWVQLPSQPQGDTAGHPAGVLPGHEGGLLQKVQGREGGGCAPGRPMLLFPISHSLPLGDQSLAFLDGVLALVDSPSHDPGVLVYPRPKCWRKRRGQLEKSKE